MYEYHVFQKTSPLTSSHFFGNFFTISTIINLIVIHPCHCSCQFNIFLTYTHQYVLASRLINCKLIYDRHLYFLACKGYGCTNITCCKKSSSTICVIANLIMLLLIPVHSNNIQISTDLHYTIFKQAPGESWGHRSAIQAPPCLPTCLLLILGLPILADK